MTYDLVGYVQRKWVSVEAFELGPPRVVAGRG